MESAHDRRRNRLSVARVRAEGMYVAILRGTPPALTGPLTATPKRLKSKIVNTYLTTTSLKFYMTTRTGPLATRPALTDSTHIHNHAWSSYAGDSQARREQAAAR